MHYININGTKLFVALVATGLYSGASDPRNEVCDHRLSDFIGIWPKKMLIYDSFEQPKDTADALAEKF